MNNYGNFENALLATDWYKTSHIDQYPDHINKLYFNLTARNNKYKNIPDNEYVNLEYIVFFGLQGFIKRNLIDMWNNTFFNKNINNIIKEYKNVLQINNMNVSKKTIDSIIELHKLGYLPITIKALPEGSKIGFGISILTIENTDGYGQFSWLINYLETILCSEIWKGCTSATTAHWYKLILSKYAEMTESDLNIINYQGYDFSFRGMSGYYDSAISGAGHLISFYGTDNIPAINYIQKIYKPDNENTIIGRSIPATDDSIMSIYGEKSELHTFEKIIEELYPNGDISILSDTWNYWKVITEYTIKLKKIILNRNGKVLFRPDSGNPIDIICGTMEYTEYDEYTSLDLIEGQEIEKIKKTWNIRKRYNYSIIKYNNKFYKLNFTIYKDIIQFNQIILVSQKEYFPTSEELGTLDILYNIFDGYKTKKGYKILDNHIRIIYGNSITPKLLLELLKRMKSKNFASENIILGIGSYTYQYVTRDTYSIDMKATYCEIKGIPHILFNNKQINNSNNHIRGLLKVVKENNKFKLIDNMIKDNYNNNDDCLKLIFKNGELLKEYSIEEIRNNLKGDD